MTYNWSYGGKTHHNRDNDFYNGGPALAEARTRLSNIKGIVDDYQKRLQEQLEKTRPVENNYYSIYKSDKDALTKQLIEELLPLLVNLPLHRIFNLNKP